MPYSAFEAALEPGHELRALGSGLVQHGHKLGVRGGRNRDFEGAAEGLVRRRGGFKQHRHPGAFQHLALCALLQHGEMRRHVAFERELLQDAGTERMNGLHLEPAGRLERRRKQAPGALAFGGVDIRNADLPHSLIKRIIVERDPTFQLIVNARRHVGGRRLGECDAEDFRRIDACRGAVQHEPDDALRQHMGLARAGIGRNEHGRRRVGGFGLPVAHRIRNDAGGAHSSSSSPPNCDHSLTRARSS